MLCQLTGLTAGVIQVPRSFKHVGYHDQPSAATCSDHVSYYRFRPQSTAEIITMAPKRKSTEAASSAKKAKAAKEAPAPAADAPKAGTASAAGGARTLVIEHWCATAVPYNA
jgi:hypothetical protein